MLGGLVISSLSIFGVEVEKMKIKILLGEDEILISLNDNPSSRSLYEQLPLSVKVEDYASNEKIFHPPRELSTLDAPVGYEPKVGDVTLYAPWGNVAIFYKNFSYSKGLIKLGEVTSGVELLSKLNNQVVKVKKAQ